MPRCVYADSLGLDYTELVRLNIVSFCFMILYHLMSGKLGFYVLVLCYASDMADKY